MRRVARWFVDAESGQTLVEFALGALVFFTVLFGTIEFGLAVWRHNMMSNLAQEGARWASVRGSASLTPASSVEVQAYVQSRAVGMTVTATTPLGAPSALKPGDMVTVQVQTTVTPLTQLIPHGTLTFSSTASMVVAR